MKCIRNGMNDIAKMGLKKIFTLSKHPLSTTASLNKNIRCKHIVYLRDQVAKKTRQRDPCPGIMFSSYDFAGQ